MKRWLHKIEVIVDKAIPWLLLILLVIIVLELGFHNFVEHNHLGHPIEIIDYFIISIFVVDLCFKYNRTRNIPKFLRKYWLDLIAVFPFFLFFRAFEGVLSVFGRTMGEWSAQAQAVMHEGIRAEKEGARVVEFAQKEGTRVLQEAEKMAKEASRLGRLHRSPRFMRFLRPFLRIPRFLKNLPKVLHFYEKPTGEHHHHEFKPKLKKSRKTLNKK